jgi:glycosyltransferase involved in cell wall biosynthesis
VKDGKKVLFIGHDASRTGAPLLLLHLMRWLKGNGAIQFEMLLLQGGPLEADYAALAPLTVLRPPSLWRRCLNRFPTMSEPIQRAWRRKLQQRLNLDRVGLVYANTAATAAGLDILDNYSGPILTHIHECQSVIELYVGIPAFERVLRKTTCFIAVSDGIKNNLVARHQVSPDSIHIIQEFIPIPVVSDSYLREARRHLLTRLGVPDTAFIAGMVGLPSWRKGIDLLVPLARAIRRLNTTRPIHLVWVGGKSGEQTLWELGYDVEHAGVKSQVHHIHECANAAHYIAGFDAFVLLSREDPFPLVVLEAATMAKPTICFQNAGSITEFVDERCGRVVPYLDVDSMANILLEMSLSQEMCNQLGRAAAEKVSKNNSVETLAPRVVEIVASLMQMGPKQPSAS